MTYFTDELDSKSNECYSVLVGDTAEKYHKLDTDFVDFIKEYNKIDFVTPSLIDGELLKRYGYFNLFPQHISAVMPLDDNSYKNFNNEISNNSFMNVNKYLIPAACLHIYPAISQMNISTPTAITTLARVYRYERGDFDGLLREWDFSVREIVFVGERCFVEEALIDIQSKANLYALDSGISVTLQYSNDMFFNDAKNRALQKIQKANKMKVELITRINDKNVALASFNYHDTHFSKMFDFDCKSKIVTGCVGFGIGRWIKALKGEI